MEPDENMLIKTDPVHFEGSHHALNYSRYQSEYQRSIADPKTFWGEMMERIDWIQKPTQIKNTSFEPGAVLIRWYEDGVLNACYNCVDRYALEHPENLAITWVADEPQSPSKTYSYRELLVEVSRFANVLKKIGVQKGSVVTIYMPMIPEALFAMLACARIGAVHSVVFGGFSAESLAERINNCDSEYVVTAGQGRARRQADSTKAKCRSGPEKLPWSTAYAGCRCAGSFTWGCRLSRIVCFCWR